MNTLRSYTFIIFACAGLCICEKDDEVLESYVEYSFINGTDDELVFNVFFKTGQGIAFTRAVLPNDTTRIFYDSFPYQEFNSINDIPALSWAARLDSLVIESESGFYRRLLGTDFELNQFDFDAQYPSMAGMYYLIQ